MKVIKRDAEFLWRYAEEIIATRAMQVLLGNPNYYSNDNYGSRFHVVATEDYSVFHDIYESDDMYGKDFSIANAKDMYTYLSLGDPGVVKIPNGSDKIIGGHESEYFHSSSIYKSALISEGCTLGFVPELVNSDILSRLTSGKLSYGSLVSVRTLIEYFLKGIISKEVLYKGIILANYTIGSDNGFSGWSYNIFSTSSTSGIIDKLPEDVLGLLYCAMEDMRYSDRKYLGTVYLNNFEKYKGKFDKELVKKIFSDLLTNSYESQSRTRDWCSLYGYLIERSKKYPDEVLTEEYLQEAIKIDDVVRNNKGLDFGVVGDYLCFF